MTRPASNMDLRAERRASPWYRAPPYPRRAWTAACAHQVPEPGAHRPAGRCRDDEKAADRLRRLRPRHGHKTVAASSHRAEWRRATTTSWMCLSRANNSPIARSWETEKELLTEGACQSCLQSAQTNAQRAMSCRQAQKSYRELRSSSVAAHSSTTLSVVFRSDRAVQRKALLNQVAIHRRWEALDDRPCRSP